MICRPFLWLSLIRLRTTSPSLAYSTMLRATSEIAVAMIVRLLLENPACAARARPCCRAETISVDDCIRTRISRSMRVLEPLVQERQTFFEVERSGHVLQSEPELHHRQRHLRLNADDHRLR